MDEITRRDFMKLGAGAVVTLGMTPILVNGAGAGGGKSGALNQTASVAAIRGNDLYAMTREVLEAVGGIQGVVHEGETVFIKPNMVTLPWAGYRNPFTAGECTKPEILIACAEECLKAGAAEVIIGDGSQMPRFDWSLAKTLDNSTDLVRAAAHLSSQYAGKVTLACLEIATPKWVEVPTGISLGKVAISSLVTRADRVISIPVAKTHKWAQLTLSLKNFVGITPLKRYGWKNKPGYNRVLLHKNDYTPEAMGQLYIDLSKAAKPDLSIIDFSICMEGDGPTASAGGESINVKNRLGSWLLLASTDPAAADATAARVMNHDDSYVSRILTMASQQGLGVINKKSIEIMGDRLDNLRIDWKPANLVFG